MVAMLREEELPLGALSDDVEVVHLHFQYVPTHYHCMHRGKDALNSTSRHKKLWQLKKKLVVKRDNEPVWLLAHQNGGSSAESRSPPCCHDVTGNSGKLLRPPQCDMPLPCGHQSTASILWNKCSRNSPIWSQ